MKDLLEAKDGKTCLEQQLLAVNIDWMNATMQVSFICLMSSFYQQQFLKSCLRTLIEALVCSLFIAMKIEGAQRLPVRMYRKISSSIHHLINLSKATELSMASCRDNDNITNFWCNAQARNKKRNVMITKVDDFWNSSQPCSKEQIYTKKIYQLKSKSFLQLL